MTLFPNALAFWALISIVGVAAVAGVVLSVVGAVVFVTQNRPERISRRESIPAYYGRLHFAH